MEQEFISVENTAKSLITLPKLQVDANSSSKNSPELFRALNQPTVDQIAQQRNVAILPITGQALSECEVIELPKQVSFICFYNISTRAYTLAKYAKKKKLIV